MIFPVVFLCFFYKLQVVIASRKQPIEVSIQWKHLSTLISNRKHIGNIDHLKKNKNDIIEITWLLCHHDSVSLARLPMAFIKFELIALEPKSLFVEFSGKKIYPFTDEYILYYIFFSSELVYIK